MSNGEKQGTWSYQGRRALRFIQPFRGAIGVVLGLTLSGAVFSAFEPLVLKALFDELGHEATPRSIAMNVGMLLLLGLGHEGVFALSRWLSWRVRLGAHYSLLEATVDRLQSLPLTFHRQESVGGIMTRLDRGIQGFLEALSEIVFNVLPALVYLALALIVMVQLDWRLSLMVMAFTPLPALIGAWAAEQQTERERTLLDRWAKIYSRFNEVLSGIATVKSFAMEDEEKRRFLHDVRDANAVVVRGVGFDAGVGAAKNLVVMLARVAAVALGGLFVFRGEITLGTLIAFLGYVQGLFGPVQGLTGIYQTLRRASVSLGTLFSILDAEDPLADAPDAADVGPIRGEVRFSNVSFAYHEKRSLLRQIDLSVRPGEMVALVGPSGAGKTTLMALLQRLYDPTAGAIFIDGADLRRLKQRSLRRQIGVVLQEALLFNDSVRNNIAYGRPTASLSEIIAVAEAANAHPFIERLQEGYETGVGERGARLSAGERQRIAIARALLKNPPILILDEATSALDAESEALVQEALARLIKGRTTFVIAHRLSTIVEADRILVLKEGEILESGTHEALIQADGYYASLVRRQALHIVRTEERPVHPHNLLPAVISRP
ncbi:MAG: ABC transporter ATP-binding protein [Nitrospirae bacterium]|nr:ABC transporter ATP-binding protein [Candidatus Manganitrophaceae bacterium]